MGEILKPVEPQAQDPIREENTIIPKELVDNGVTLENLKVLDYLGMKDSAFDRDVIAKVSKIADFTKDKDLQMIDLKLGNPYGVTKLDKIYAYVLLEQQEADINAKRDLILREKQRYDSI